MPGGDKNIKPSDNPKPFKKGNKAAEVWTEEKALELGQGMLDWFKADKMNIYFEEFIVEVKDLHPDITSYLASKFTTFSDLLQKCYAIRKRKVMQYSTFGDANASMAKFDLINNHDMVSEKTQNVNQNETIITEIDWTGKSNNNTNPETEGSEDISGQ